MSFDPKALEHPADPIAAYDDARERCPVASSGAQSWAVFRHGDVLRILTDHGGFGNTVSRHLSVPNGMDPPEHTAYRCILEPYLAQPRVDAFELDCRAHVDRLLAKLPRDRTVEMMNDFALPFAAGVQCAFLGWPADLVGRLISWTGRNQDATRMEDRIALSGIAREFESLVDELLDARAGRAPDDLTGELMGERVWGRDLSYEEIASIMRNWTVGEVGTIAAAVGIVAQFLAEQADTQRMLRARPDLLERAIDEILRIRGPLLSNRRIATAPAVTGGQHLEAGDLVTLYWVAANRDPRAFAEPEVFRLDRDDDANLLYGAGIHVCPGAALARMELRVVFEQLFACTSWIESAHDQLSVAAHFPASGFRSVPLHLF